MDNETRGLGTSDVLVS